MDVISRAQQHSSSGLNPNAPLFVPLAYRTVEDFSDQWWDLVKSSNWFRDYWLQECLVLQQQQQQQQEEEDSFDDEMFLPEDDSLFYQPQQDTEEEKGRKEDYVRDLVRWGSDKWRGPRGPLQSPRISGKAPKIVSVKVSPRPIQQPR